MGLRMHGYQRHYRVPAHNGPSTVSSTNADPWLPAMKVKLRYFENMGTFVETTSRKAAMLLQQAVFRFKRDGNSNPF
jgi:hypothetical protein